MFCLLVNKVPPPTYTFLKVSNLITTFSYAVPSPELKTVHLAETNALSCIATELNVQLSVSISSPLFPLEGEYISGVI